jgi:glycosyltransferase involved in cell wall biosynthesis
MRKGLGVPDGAVLFGVFGGLTFDKRVPQGLQAFAALRRFEPGTHLLLAGAPDQRLNLPRRIADLGLTGHVTIAPDLDDDLFERAIAAVDVSLNLRWPTARETSGPWVQALAAARPTVIIDAEHQADVPALDPQTWRVRPCRVAGEPVTIAIDLLDDEHSLQVAMRRLARDPQLRVTLGTAARVYWEQEHTVDRMADDYERLIHGALTRPDPAPDLPSSLRPDPLRHTRALVDPLGDIPCTLF